MSLGVCAGRTSASILRSFCTLVRRLEILADCSERLWRFHGSSLVIQRRPQLSSLDGHWWYWVSPGATKVRAWLLDALSSCQCSQARPPDMALCELQVLRDTAGKVQVNNNKHLAALAKPAKHAAHIPRHVCSLQ